MSTRLVGGRDLAWHRAPIIKKQQQHAILPGRGCSRHIKILGRGSSWELQSIIECLGMPSMGMPGNSTMPSESPSSSSSMDALSSASPTSTTANATNTNDRSVKYNDLHKYNHNSNNILSHKLLNLRPSFFVHILDIY